MKISNTNKNRIRIARTLIQRLGFVALVIFSAISGIGWTWRYFFPPAPLPLVPTAREVVNSSDPVKAFAEGCVESLLSGIATAGTDIVRCYPDGRRYTPANGGSLLISNVKAQRTKWGPMNDAVTVVAVKVGVDQQIYPGAPKVKANYQIPISIYQGTGMQAIDKISAVPDDPPGAYLPLGYPVNIPRTVQSDNPNADPNTLSPMWQLLTGFAAAYLTPAGGLDRFIIRGAPITALARYTAMPGYLPTVTAVQAETMPSDSPADGTTLAVHIDVSARRPDYSIENLSYPLTLQASGGSWFIAQIDALPVLQDLTPTPAPAPPPTAPAR
ncbi:hypothetical protein [Mycobacteroides abscessus]|uniref:hypothetical protein n=1 Tax=Mycobacteroides abscessus TaxID=36809 RepID=UPI0009283C81|nr:hypothetical protein [Mycobacteroides abscessus]SHW37111.1 Uncharacterised protein [Mycobacteroides abscessus subsp. abscessus]SIE87768.1 Uncharacterised protein [Mycobacteroides abscessus subsp. abscessus]SII12444.1 Uncharacterised protein [Mycobacteroides abscessus subsp. abscessus]